MELYETLQKIIFGAILIFGYYSFAFIPVAIGEFIALAFHGIKYRNYQLKIVGITCLVYWVGFYLLNDNHRLTDKIDMDHFIIISIIHGWLMWKITTIKNGRRERNEIV
jgi:hypothetical protein